MNTFKAAMGRSVDQDTDVSAMTFLTPGQQLSQAREAKGLSLEMVAKQLFVSEKIIIALESDDYTKIVAPVYARGYLLSYARLMQIPTEPLLVEFAKFESNVMVPVSSISAHSRSHCHPHGVQAFKMTRESHTLMRHEQHQWIMYATAVVVVITLILWGNKYYKQYKASASSVAVAAEAPVSSATTSLAIPNAKDVKTEKSSDSL